MWPICNMLWRIGDILPVDEQLAWCLEAGFDGIGLHASAGHPGQWRGVDPAAASPRYRRELRRQLGPFARCEVHAPFSIVLGPGDPGSRDPGSGDPAEGAAALEPVIAFAADIGAAVVTAHGHLPDTCGTQARWLEAMGRLDACAASNGIRLGLEVVSGFDQVAAWRLPQVGVTLDVGHMYAQDEGQHLQPYGSIGDLVRALGPSLFHLHVHDVEAAPSTPGAPLLDHLEVGVGQVDFEDLMRGLAANGYGGALCLEMNPDRVSPEGIGRSLRRLRALIHDGAGNRQNSGTGTESGAPEREQKGGGQ